MRAVVDTSRFAPRIDTVDGTILHGVRSLFRFDDSDGHHISRQLDILHDIGGLGHTTSSLALPDSLDREID